MKVKYTKLHTDEYGDTYYPGWVAEHTDAEGQRRIDLGVCEQVDQDARSRRQAIETPASVECVPEKEEKKPLLGLKSK